jgi:glycosyltransferase involved in cell wall biosynthesis
MSSTPATDSSPDLASNRVPESAVIVPVYRNAEHIPALLERLSQLHKDVPGGIEAVLVVDGSPDDCYRQLADGLSGAPFPSQLLALSRNFGSFAAIRAGLEVARGRFFAVMAADLQEPADLVVEMLDVLRSDEADVVIGSRASRRDPLFSRLAASAFWGLSRRLVEPGIPRGGVDVFGCNRAFREQLLSLNETHSSLIGQLFWLGFRRREIAYDRAPRLSGTSGWSFKAKRQYFFDSLFAFTDLPIRAFIMLGLLGLISSVVLGFGVLAARLSGLIEVPGYTATVVTIVFFSGLNLFGLGVIGSYVWRVYENTKQRPLAVVMRRQGFDGVSS